MNGERTKVELSESLSVSGGSRETRRAFLQSGALVLGGFALGGAPRNLWAAEQEQGPEAAKPALRIGIITDLHYADRDRNNTRYYRETLDKLPEAIEKFNSAELEMAVCLGDLIDEAPDVAGEIGHLKKIEAIYAQFKGERHYVLGNHCVWTLTKQEYLDNCGMKKPHYAFDKGGFHFVVLDACYKQDGTPYGRKNANYADTIVPAEELEWLKDDLAATKLPTIILAHQRLDFSQSDGNSNWGVTVKNSPEVRKVLEGSGRVQAVLQGHSHQNDHREVGGIHYCVFRAMVDGSGQEQSGYSIANLFADGSIRIEGFRQQKNWEWKKA